MRVTLFAVPVPGQCVRGDDRFLGTVRTHMHKAPLTALAAGLAAGLADNGLPGVEVRIVDLQTSGRDRVKYGSLQLGEGVVLDKYRVGARFESADSEIMASSVVGVSANYTHSRRIVADFLKHARETNPLALLVVGGTDATGDVNVNGGRNLPKRGGRKIPTSLRSRCAQQGSATVLGTVKGRAPRRAPQAVSSLDGPCAP